MYQFFIQATSDDDLRKTARVNEFLRKNSASEGMQPDAGQDTKTERYGAHQGWHMSSCGLIQADDYDHDFCIGPRFAHFFQDKNNIMSRSVQPFQREEVIDRITIACIILVWIENIFKRKPNKKTFLRTQSVTHQNIKLTEQHTHYTSLNPNRVKRGKTG